MPKWLRQFTFSKINDFYTKEAETAEATKNNKSGRTTLIDSSGNVNRESWKGLPQGTIPSSSPSPGKSVKYK